ncbi:type II toxin-antitoxin system VapC family toxin [Nocardioides sp.]|uniref:type II toxin-antitoxin system VapC family toxin n=1 Tax=Nocardioides sp. TaxID=35761 RepID=UPI0039E4B4BF
MTTVVDASALAELVVFSDLGSLVDRHLRTSSGGRHIPHLAVIETTSTLRGWLRGRRITEERATAALATLTTFPAIRWPADQLLPRIWSLRDNLTPYDATYVALAESLDAELVTYDDRLRRSLSGVSKVRIVSP